MIDVTKGYKAFEPGLICRGKYYAENTTFEEEGGKLCGAGMMHYCTNPLDCLEYYPLLNDDCTLNDFAEVVAEEAPVGDGKKYATKKLHIGAKLDLRGLIKAAFSFIWETSEHDGLTASAERNAKLAASGDSAKLAASGDSAKLAASGDSAKLAASGYSAQLAASGDYAKLAASGDSAKLAASGDYAKLAASGDSAKLAASGDYAQLAASGDSAQLAASGDYAQLAASGEDSIVAGIGFDNIGKAALGCWLVLAEWVWNREKERYVPACVKAAQIDGEKLKPDTYYKLQNGEFTEVNNG